MKKYKMEEWLKIHDDIDKSGSTHIIGANLNKDFTVKSLEVRTDYGMCSGYGALSADRVLGIDGNKQFVFDEDGYSLVVDKDEKVRSSIKLPNVEYKNKKIVPLVKWVEDMKYHQKKSHKKDEDWYRYVEVFGCEVDSEGAIRAINAKITYDHNYGPFGPITSDHKICAEDLLTFTYGMHRNDLNDDWRGSYGNRKRKCYFNDNFDLVFDDDGLYHI